MIVENGFKKTESKLVYYLKGYLQQEISNRVLELKYPSRPADEINVKVQSTKGSASPQEKSVTNLLIDRDLAILKRRQLTISNFLHNLSVVEYEILSQYYLKRKSWRDVAQAVNYSERHARRKRDELIIELTSLLSWDN